MWADHADSVSNAYSGTGALKTDATRTGKRTKQGVLKDGWNSVVRYVKNNYLDGPRQVSLSLSLDRISFAPRLTTLLSPRMRSTCLPARGAFTEWPPARWKTHGRCS